MYREPFMAATQQYNVMIDGCAIVEGRARSKAALRQSLDGGKIERMLKKYCTRQFTNKISSGNRVNTIADHNVAKLNSPNHDPRW